MAAPPRPLPCPSLGLCHAPRSAAERAAPGAPPRQDKEKKREEKYKEMFKPLLDYTKELLGKKVEKVQISKHLTLTLTLTPTPTLTLTLTLSRVHLHHRRAQRVGEECGHLPQLAAHPCLPLRRLA